MSSETFVFRAFRHTHMHTCTHAHAHMNTHTHNYFILIDSQMNTSHSFINTVAF